MDAKNMFTNGIMHTIRNEANMENALSSLNEYAIRYPMLKENNAFNDIRIILMMGCCIEEFGRGNYQAGFHHMKEFERTTENKHIVSNLLTVNAIIVEAYSLAASYYFRTGQQSMARECLETGLRYVPGNWELQDKMKMLDQ